jgi:hypothetical protein
MDTIAACYASTTVPNGAADGTATEGRKGIAYLRDYFVPASPAAAVEHERVSVSA